MYVCYVPEVDMRTRIELLRLARDESLRTAYQAQKLLDALDAPYPVEEEGARRLAAVALRYKMDVEAAWKTLPWWRRLWIALRHGA